MPAVPASPFRFSMLCTPQWEKGAVLCWQSERQLMIFSAYRLAATLGLLRWSSDIAEVIIKLP